MDFVTLDIFIKVAETQSVTQASKLCQRAPSNITTRIQQLEAEMNCQLFTRNHKMMVLTPAGEIFKHHAEQLVSIYHQSKQILNPEHVSGELRLGSMESTAASRLPQLLPNYHQSYPDVRLSITTGASAQLLERLLKQQLHAVFIALARPEQPAELTAMGLTLNAAFREDLVLLYPAHFSTLPTPQELAKLSLATFVCGCSYRALLENWFIDQGVTTEDRIQEVGSYYAMLACVSAGLSCCLLPRSVLDLSLQPANTQHYALLESTTWLATQAGEQQPALNALKEMIKLKN